MLQIPRNIYHNQGGASTNVGLFEPYCCFDDSKIVQMKRSASAMELADNHVKNYQEIKGHGNQEQQRERKRSRTISLTSQDEEKEKVIDLLIANAAITTTTKGSSIAEDNTNNANVTPTTSKRDDLLVLPNLFSMHIPLGRENRNETDEKQQRGEQAVGDNIGSVDTLSLLTNVEAVLASGENERLRRLQESYVAKIVSEMYRSCNIEQCQQMNNSKAQKRLRTDIVGSTAAAGWATGRPLMERPRFPTNCESSRMTTALYPPNDDRFYVETVVYTKT